MSPSVPGLRKQYKNHHILIFMLPYKVFKQIELAEYIRNEENLKGSGLIITEFGDKFMMIKWERFKK